MPIPNRYYERVAGWRPSLVLRMIADTYRFRPITDRGGKLINMEVIRPLQDMPSITARAYLRILESSGVCQ